MGVQVTAALPTGCNNKKLFSDRSQTHKNLNRSLSLLLSLRNNPHRVQKTESMMRQCENMDKNNTCIRRAASGCLESCVRPRRWDASPAEGPDSCRGRAVTVLNYPLNSPSLPPSTSIHLPARLTPPSPLCLGQ